MKKLQQTALGLLMVGALLYTSSDLKAQQRTAQNVTTTIEYGKDRDDNGGGPPPPPPPPLSVEEHTRDIVSVYPNPCNENVNLQFPNNQGKLVTIYDLTGNKVMETEVHDVEVTLQVSHLRNGIYFIHVGNTAYRFTKS